MVQNTNRAFGGSRQFWDRGVIAPCSQSGAATVLEIFAHKAPTPTSHFNFHSIRPLFPHSEVGNECWRRLGKRDCLTLVSAGTVDKRCLRGCGSALRKKEKKNRVFFLFFLLALESFPRQKGVDKQEHSLALYSSCWERAKQPPKNGVSLSRSLSFSLFLPLPLFIFLFLVFLLKKKKTRKYVRRTAKCARDTSRKRSRDTLQQAEVTAWRKGGHKWRHSVFMTSQRDVTRLASWGRPRNEDMTLLNGV